jgi:hypothetical protein
MVSNCANPQCAKPLLYLREGRVFVFDLPDRSVKSTGEKPGHRLEHYWLCGDCSQRFIVQRDSDKGIRLVPRLSVRKYVVREKVEDSQATAVLAAS